MSVREFVKKSPIVGIAVFVIAIGALVASWVMNKTPSAEIPTAYFTNDDGKTYFSDDPQKVAPFDHDGKPAVIAHVFKADTDGKLFVGYMEKYSDAAAAILRRTNTASKGSTEAAMSTEEIAKVSNGMMYKLPGEAKWNPVDAAGRRYLPMTITMKVKGPDGKGATPLDEF